jgi:LPS O-antigen subunit length determinant protein (WzzB/FepE family)
MKNDLNNEIDLIEILKKLYTSKKIIIYCSALFIILGIIISLTSPIKYSSSTTFIPQNQENSTSSFSGVASLVGINLGSSSGSDIPPSMYPQIGESANFKRKLLDKIINKKNNLTLKDFLVNHYNIF